MSYRVMVTIILLCHYMSAFSALGMPLFLPVILQELDTSIDSGWVGLLFILPTLMTALAARFWGKFADTYGRKISLLRAEIGLVVGFLICGFSQNLWQLIVGLSIQGLFGGTMAASNAYLAANITDKRALKQVLNLTQFSARLALITAPIGLGILAHYYQILSLYRWLALLPLLAFLLSCLLQNDRIVALFSSPIKLNAITKAYPLKQAPSNSRPLPKQHHVKKSRLIKALYTNPYLFISLLQFFFAFCMVVTFPYFLPFAKTFSLNTSQIGQLYALPHVIYLICQLSCGHTRIRTPSSVLPGFMILTLSVVMHLTETLSLILLARVLFGLGMFLCYRSLHEQMANTSQTAHSGKIFSRYDALSKWGGVLAGLSVTVFVPVFGLLSPFLLSAVMALIAIMTIVLYQQHQINDAKTSMTFKNNKQLHK